MSVGRKFAFAVCSEDGLTADDEDVGVLGDSGDGAENVCQFLLLHRRDSPKAARTR